MDCREARDLLDRGVMPGPRPAHRAELGFHLSTCPACRAHQSRLQEQLLANMLVAAPWGVAADAAPEQAATPVGAGADRPVRPGPHLRGRDALDQALRQLPSSGVRWLWYAGLGTLVLMVVLILGAVGTVVLSMNRIHQNVQAMIVTPRPAQAVAEAGSRATLVPTVAPLPTATAVPPTVAPTATATLAPTATLVPTATPEPTPAPSGPVTVLLLGSDRRPGEGEPSRTDAVIVARIDPERKRVALLSLPRDLIASIPGYGQARINAANVYGTIYGLPGGGLETARATISGLLGVPIDHYVYIDFEGFIGAIDSLGGVPVEVPRELYDAAFPTMDYGYTVAHFTPGVERMDGARALMYSRIRHPDSDFERMRRQQAVLLGVLARLREDNVFESVRHLEAVTTALRGYVKTDIPEDRLLGLVWALRDLTPEAVERHLLDENQVYFGSGGDRWAAFAVSGALDELTRRLLGG